MTQGRKNTQKKNVQLHPGVVEIRSRDRNA